MTARIASGVLVSALIRRVSSEGGSAAVLGKGDPEAGSILVIQAERGRFVAIRERLLRADGRYGWDVVGPAADSDGVELSAYLDRRRSRDGDLWIVELDIPDGERFIAETTGIG